MQPNEFEMSCFPDGHRFAFDMLLKCGKATVVGIGFITALDVVDVATNPTAVATTLFKSVLAVFIGTPSPPATDVNSTEEPTLPYLRRYVKTVKKEKDGGSGAGLWWVPVTSSDWTHRASIMGNSLLPHIDMLRMYAFFFPQMLLGSGWRCLQHYLDVGTWKASHSDNHQTYLAIVNSSMATYYNDGAFVFYNCSFHSHGMRQLTTFKTIRVVCDHQNGNVNHIELILEDGQSLCGSAATRTEERDGGGVLYIVEDPDEIGILVVQICAVVCHPHVHWWANGVAEVTQWPLHRTSNIWVQFLNYAAMFQSLFFYHASSKNNTDMLTNNLLGGMPSHNDIPEEVLKWSVLHKMVGEARVQIRDHFDSIGTRINNHELNSLLCATIFHSADHHYFNKYTGVGGLSATLKADFRAMRICIVGGFRWIGFKFLCKQYYHEDPVCRILYDVAMKHDPELAEGILTVGISI